MSASGCHQFNWYCLANYATPLPPDHLGGFAVKTHIETITTAQHTYTIGVEGTMDGTNTRDPVGYSNYQQAWEANLSVRLENMGDEALKNPWITVNGKRHWRSIEDILAEILDDDMSEAEKARAIWEFARKHRYHFTTGDDEVKGCFNWLDVGQLAGTQFQFNGLSITAELFDLDTDGITDTCGEYIRTIPTSVSQKLPK